MNKKAELFKVFLDERKINVFQMLEVPNDQLNTVVFRSNIEVEGQKLETVLLLDNSIYNIIRVRVADGALKAANEVALIKAINEMNAKYKVFKYYFVEGGNLILDACVPSRAGEIDPEMLLTVMDVIVKHLAEDYKEIMKTIWA